MGDTADGGWDGIFVSYSHHDAVWAQRFEKVLKPLVRSRRLRLWVDTDIRVGNRWHPEIIRAIGRSSVALLLVSVDFLDSDFIMDEELPTLIGQGVRLASVLVGDCLWRHVPELAQVQWLHDPDRDGALNLVATKPGRRDQRLREICDRLIAMAPDTRRSRSRDYDPLSLPADSPLGYDPLLLPADSPLGYDRPLSTTHHKIAYQRAIDNGQTEVIPMAEVHLGMLLAEQGDPVGARTAYQRAIDSGHAKWAPMAAVHAGALLARHGDPVGARTAYQWAIDSGHTEAVPMAEVHLGMLLAEQGDPVGARTAYQRAIDSGHAKWAPNASAKLRRLK